MKQTLLVSSTLLALFLSTGCDRKSAEAAKHLSELERKANEATERQQQLEQQLADQKIAAERDAIERERMEIEQARAELERQQGDAAAAEAEKLRQREQELAAREGKVELLQSQLEDKENDLQQRDQALSEKDRDLAGREAIAFNAEDDDNSAPVGDYGMFYDSLSAYGSWFETPDYGYVWQPVIVRDVSWRPYTRGRWACTDRGWTWLSDEPFGWATYHYGRWALCRGHGWIWVPGCEWAPSWVCWRSSGSHIGWAPLPPETLAYRGHRWDSSVEVTFGIAAAWFNFVEIRDFGYPIHHHCLPYTQNNIYIAQSINITNINFYNRRVICGGPKYFDIAHQTKRRPPFYRIEENRQGRPGRDSAGMRQRIEGNRLLVAAPYLDVAWNEGLRPNQIKGRIESVKLERQEELRPEVADRYRQSRMEQRGRAEQAIAEFGGNEQFNQRRLEQLAENRRQVAQNNRRAEDNRNNNRRTEQGKVADRTERAQDVATQPNDGPRITPPRGESQRPQEDTATRARKPQEEQVADQSRRRQDAQRQPDQATPSNDGPRVFPPRDSNKQAQNDVAERTRKTQTRQEENGRPQTREPQDQPKPQEMEDNRRQQQEQARQQQENQRQREQQRQQQEEARREQASQQQQEEARREQARQQQQEEARREQARQQQQEEARREQARQQQQEESRREQARQQQQEESRREQARQQQQEESRREQARQQQQEESRREQARQQQEESQRQERNRQEQQRQDDERRGRNR